jgi:hypothetical protein
MANSFSKVLVALIGLGLASLALEIGWRYPDNHGGGPQAHGFYFSGILCVAVVLSLWKRKLFSVSIVFSLFCLLFVWFIDWRNISVHYDKWTARGMPGWGEAAQPMQKMNPE